jgi:flagellar biosynthetic protein FlhB
MVAATMALKSFGPSMYETLARATTETLKGLKPEELTPERVGKLFQDWVLVLAKVGLPVTAVLLGIGVAVGLGQTRGLVTFKLVAPKFSRVNPVEGFTRIFSKHTLVELVKSLLKLALVGYVAYHDVAGLIPTLPNLLHQTVAAGVAEIAARAVTGLQHIGMGLLAIGMLDYGYQYWEFRQSLRMTKQEVKQEHKQQEGNPEVKQKQRAKAREMARRRKALKDVPLADVVVTNPTHFAVAIKYEAGVDASPRVLAKGSDLLAQRIKVIAKQNEVPTVENRPLARTLYATVDVGKTVPPELYQAVAEVLAFVYNLRREKRRKG